MAAFLVKEHALAMGLAIFVGLTRVECFLFDFFIDDEFATSVDAIAEEVSLALLENLLALLLLDQGGALAQQSFFLEAVLLCL